MLTQQLDCDLVSRLNQEYIASLETKLELMYDTYMTANHEFGLVWKYANEIQKLKAENAQLKADNLDLMKQVEINGKALDIACIHIIDRYPDACPPYLKCDERNCPHWGDVVQCEYCWKEYFLQQAKGE